MGYFNNDNFKFIRKIFYIVAIISMILSIKSRVFGAYADYTENVTYLNNNESSVVMTGNNYTYTLQLPSWIYNYDNILITINGNRPGAPTNPGGYFVMSNDKIYIDENGGIGVENGGSYVFTAISYWLKTNYSNDTINNFTSYTYNLNTDKSIRWNSYIGSGTNGSIALKGLIYNYSNDEVLIDSTPINYPHFDNVTEIEEGNPNGVYISRGDYSDTDYLYFHLLEVTYTVPSSDNTIYYYNDKTFALKNNTKYYQTYDADSNNQYSYYKISATDLSLDADSSYLYILSNSSSQIQNSNGLISIDSTNGIYDVIESDTTGVITQAEAQSTKLKKIEQDLQEQGNTTNSINNSLTNTTPDNTTGDNIDTSLSFDNTNSSLTNMNSGFFTRLTSMLTSLLDYNLSEDTVVYLPLPFTHNQGDIIGDYPNQIALHSNIIYQNLRNPFPNYSQFNLTLIIQAFWTYIFGFYLWKFINKIYIAVSSGNILDNFNSNNEAITNDML